VRVLKEKDKDLLRKLWKLTQAHFYHPQPVDVSTAKTYRRVLYQLYKLEKMFYIRLHRKGTRIRAIEVLARP